MRKTLLLLSIIMLLYAHQSFAHTLYLKDGRAINADDVWEEKLGYVIDDVTLYGLKKSGMPQGLRNVLVSLKDTPFPQNTLIEKIQQKIGTANFQKYQKAFKTYLSEKTVISYEKRGNTIKIDKSLVKKIDYIEPKSLPSNLFDEGDIESQNAVQHERERLQERLQRIKRYKSRYSAGARERQWYKEDELEITELLRELNRDPLGYFLRRYPEKVNLMKPLSEEKCSDICGRELSSVNAPVIKDDSSEESHFEACMWSCTGKEKYRF